MAHTSGIGGNRIGSEDSWHELLVTSEGCALKKKRRCCRLSPKQKNFVMACLLMGERTGKKLTVEKFASMMHNNVDERGNKMFTHQTDTACSWLVCHSATVGGTVRGNTVQIVSTYPASPAAQFFGEASRASPQHGWRSAYSLRETLSPTQGQNQH